MGLYFQNMYSGVNNDFYSAASCNLHGFCSVFNKTESKKRTQGQVKKNQESNGILLCCVKDV